MDAEIILKFLAALVGLIGAAKIFYDFSTGRRSRMRDEYKFAKDFFLDLNSTSPMHPFLREKGYQAIAGTSLISGEIIEYLLTLTRPDRAMRDYVLGEHYLEHISRSGDLKIEFKEKYKENWTRKIRLYGYSGLYLIFALLALSPLILGKFLNLPLSTMLSSFLICSAVFGPYAWLSLRASVKMYRAQMLVSHQDKHTRRIMVSVKSANSR